MPRSFEQVFPNWNSLSQLAPEETAYFLLDWLCEIEDMRRSPNKYNDTLQGNFTNYLGNPQNTSLYDEVGKKIMEAWNYLERLGLVAQKPGEVSLQWYYVTERGRSVRDKEAFHKFQRTEIFKLDHFDSVLAQKVFPLLIRGDYETAITVAYKELEVRIRDACGLDNSQYGLDLIRKHAFKPESGILTDQSLHKQEQEAMMQMFAGAIGFYKNASSHRYLGVDDPYEVSEIIGLANHLIRIVESLRPDNRS